MNPIFQFEPSVDKITPDPEQVIRAMGYKNGVIPNGYQEILDRLFAEAKEIVTPRCGFVVLPKGSTVVETGKMILNGKTFNTGKIVSGQLKKMEQVALYAGTIGPEFDRWSRHTFDKVDPLSGYMIDLLGSTMAESLADWLEEKIAEYARKEGHFCSKRYGPGNCGWNVAEQRKLFEFFPKSFCGIHLTESALMEPHKSVSGVIGIGPKVIRKDYLCVGCKIVSCYRNPNYNPSLGYKHF